jgi:hypothetical protein
VVWLELLARRAYCSANKDAEQMLTSLGRCAEIQSNFSLAADD